MQANPALDEQQRRTTYPFSTLHDRANVLIVANLSAGNIAYKLLEHLGATATGPIVAWMRHPVHALEQGAGVEDTVTMAVVAVVDAQDRNT